MVHHFLLLAGRLQRAGLLRLDGFLRRPLRVLPVPDSYCGGKHHASVGQSRHKDGNGLWYYKFCVHDWSAGGRSPADRRSRPLHRAANLGRLCVAHWIFDVFNCEVHQGWKIEFEGEMLENRFTWSSTTMGRADMGWCLGLCVLAMRGPT